MIRLLAIAKAKKQIPLKKFLLAFFVCAFVVTWIGISTIQADEDDPADNMDNTELSFQNAAQEQRAENIATQVALEDPDAEIEQVTEDIYNMRSSGMGWGEIAQYYGFHPSISGLGHFKSNHENAAQISKHPHWKTELQEATARSFKGNSMKGHGMSDSASNGKKFDFPKTKLGGQNYSGQNKNRGLALGHSKDKGGGHGSGRGAGNSGRGGGKK